MPASDWLKRLARLPFRAAGYDIRRIGVSPDPVDTVSALLRARSAPVVFDVGANAGQTVARFRPGLPTAVFHCFEPNPAVFEQLKKATSGDPLVHAHQCGVGDAPGRLTLRLNEQSGTNSFLTPAGAGSFAGHPDYRQVGSAEVEVVTLAGFCASLGVRRIDLLKLDTQGYELKVLAGAGDLLTPSAVGLVFSEVTFVPLYENQFHFDELMGFLRHQGYKLVDLYDREVHREVGLIQANALFMPA